MANALIQSDSAPGVTLYRPCPASRHGCPVQLFARATREYATGMHNFWYPVAGLVPATHVLPSAPPDGKKAWWPGQARPRGSWVVSGPLPATELAQPDIRGSSPA